MKKILVTGGAGYIGSHAIVELINGGYEVASIDNFCNSSPEVFKRIFKLTGKKIKNYEVDLCDGKKLEALFKGKKFDAIIHFAAYKAVGESVEDPLKYYRNNIGAMLGALDLVRDCGIRYFIFSSTCAVYDPVLRSPFTEKSKLAPSSPYGMTKKIDEEILQNYASIIPSFKAVSLRYFNPAGAHPSLLIGESPKRGSFGNLVPVINKAARIKKPFLIFGDTYNTPDGTGIRDYIHVADLAQAHISALEYLERKNSPSFDVFNVGTGKGVSVLEMVRAFEKANSLKAPFKIVGKRPGDMETVFANTKKSSKLLKCKPKFSIKDIMKTSWGWEQKSFK